MAYRDKLPQLADRLFLTDGGMETVLIFHHGVELPCFAAFDLLRRAGGEQLLRDYFEPYLAIGRDADAGFLLGAPTWRANPDWGAQIGYDAAGLQVANRRAVSLVEGIRRDHAGQGRPIVLEALVGPRGDGYQPGGRMTAGEAQAYHATQLRVLADTAVDMICAATLSYPEEAIGITRAAQAVGLPSAISFTVETDGRLPTGDRLGDAIRLVDDATDGAAAYFMVNCAHPTHLALALDREPWTARLCGFRANASTASHADLDEADALDSGDPGDLAASFRTVADALPALTVVGGCCGTDERHVRHIWRALRREA